VKEGEEEEDEGEREGERRRRWRRKIWFKNTLFFQKIKEKGSTKKGESEGRTKENRRLITHN
jgi:hypothetical protein